MVTLRDIAAEAGVSITTVSNVVHNRKSRVSPELVKKIWEIIEREHYVPSMSARSLANDHSFIIGVITHLTPQNTGSTMSDPFLSAFVDSIEKRTREEGYYLMVRSVEDAAELDALSRSWRLSGLILTGMFQDDFFNATLNLRTPFVLIDSYVDHPGVYSVGLEDEKGGYLAARHLLENGHRAVAFASPSIMAWKASRFRAFSILRVVLARTFLALGGSVLSTAIKYATNSATNQTPQAALMPVAHKDNCLYLLYSE